MRLNTIETLPGRITTFSFRVGIRTYKVSPGLAEDGLSVTRCKVLEALRPRGVFGNRLGSNFSGIVVMSLFMTIVLSHK